MKPRRRRVKDIQWKDKRTPKFRPTGYRQIFGVPVVETLGFFRLRMGSGTVSVNGNLTCFHLHWNTVTDALPGSR